jgi:hypothetical protein
MVETVESALGLQDKLLGRGLSALLGCLIVYWRGGVLRFIRGRDPSVADLANIPDLDFIASVNWIYRAGR